MDFIKEYLPFLIPIAALELGLIAAALIHLLKRKKTQNLNVFIWAIIIIFGEMIGPVLYFLIGREDE